MIKKLGNKKIKNFNRIKYRTDSLCKEEEYISQLKNKLEEIKTAIKKQEIKEKNEEIITTEHKISDYKEKIKNLNIQNITKALIKIGYKAAFNNIKTYSKSLIYDKKINIDFEHDCNDWNTCCCAKDISSILIDSNNNNVNVDENILDISPCEVQFMNDTNPPIKNKNIKDKNLMRAKKIVKNVIFIQRFMRQKWLKRWINERNINKRGLEPNRIVKIDVNFSKNKKDCVIF